MVRNAKVRVYKISYSGGYSEQEWFEMSLTAYAHDAPSARREDYDYVQVVPIDSWKSFPSSNDGSQGWRHKTTGWTIPDYCRQYGGSPDVWSKDHHYRQLKISADSPVLDHLIVS